MRDFCVGRVLSSRWLEVSEKKDACVLVVAVSRTQTLCLHPAVFPVHPAAGGCADVHPGAVLEILRGAAPAVGPQLHHGGVGPLLQPRRHSGQADSHVGPHGLRGVGRNPRRVPLTAPPRHAALRLPSP